MISAYDFLWNLAGMLRLEPRPYAMKDYSASLRAKLIKAYREEKTYYIVSKEEDDRRGDPLHHYGPLTEEKFDAIVARMNAFDEEMFNDLEQKGFENGEFFFLSYRPWINRHYRMEDESLRHIPLVDWFKQQDISIEDLQKDADIWYEVKKHLNTELVKKTIVLEEVVWKL